MQSSRWHLIKEWKNYCNNNTLNLASSNQMQSPEKHKIVMRVHASVASRNRLCYNHLSRAHFSYKLKSIEKSGTDVCPATDNQRESIQQDLDLFINNTIILPALTENGTCGCGGPGWRRVAYLNMSDPTQTCPPAWELITTLRRSCGRPFNAGYWTCYSCYVPYSGHSNTLRSVE